MVPSKTDLSTFSHTARDVTNLVAVRTNRGQSDGSIYTLSFGNIRKRHWDFIGKVSQRDEIKNKLFPNVKYGLNNRSLVLTLTYMTV